MSETTQVFTTENWQREVLESKEPVLVDFWAEWCAPCRAVAPTIEALAGELAGQVKVGKVNVDQNEAISAQYGIRSIPTLLLFRGGQVVGERIGAAPAAQIRRFIDENAGVPVSTTPR